MHGELEQTDARAYGREAERDARRWAKRETARRARVEGRRALARDRAARRFLAFILAGGVRP